MNKPDPIHSEDIREQLEDYFYQALEVELLLRLFPDDEDTICQIVDLLVDTCATKRRMLRIAGDDKPAEVVRSRLKKLNADHIRFVLNSLAENATPVRNMKQYLLVSLYNAPTTMNLHYQNLTKLLADYGVTVGLLSGSLTAKEKRRAKEKIASGEWDIVIGTHALIQDGVAFADLGLVITDEQHRFGVKQRETFSLKGSHPHILVMSATPIPRTLAIILYGDLDISIIDELPAKRLPIKNCVVGTSYRPKAYSFIEKQVQMGRQAYVICPMVEESEGLDAENVDRKSTRLNSSHT